MKKYLCGLATIAISMPLYAGFGLETTRVIYNEKDRSQSVVAFNTDQETNYLVQTWIEDEQDKITADFVTTPPILKLRPLQKNTLQITKNSNQSPTAESLYWLNVKFVAPSDKDIENVLKYSMTHRIKLIYRPDSIEKLELTEEVKKINWAIQDGTLSAHNPTAFFINIASVSINGNVIESPSYLKPQSKTKFLFPTDHAVPNPADHIKIALNYINDYGKSIIETF